MAVEERQKVFVSESILLEPNNFPSNYNDTILRMLEEGEICSPDSNDLQKYYCNPQYFRVFRLGKKIPYSNGLICESRSLMFNGGASKNVLVIKVNDNAKAERIDHFLGKLIELRTTPEGYYDLVMSYRDSQIGNVTVLHHFEDGYFKPVEVLELQDFVVKEAYKDSLFEVYLKDFRWGH